MKMIEITTTGRIIRAVIGQIIIEVSYRDYMTAIDDICAIAPVIMRLDADEEASFLDLIKLGAFRIKYAGRMRKMSGDILG